jgi:hypothetical protein
MESHRAESRSHASGACAHLSDGLRALAVVLTGAVELSRPPRQPAELVYKRV